ncbi:MAG: hypothetical protein E6I45_06965 [Chloroflexi bacterium]|nr:MAG: hypothetical protein E6I45_06965 [Chloroflexota bacterium]
MSASGSDESPSDRPNESSSKGEVVDEFGRPLARSESGGSGGERGRDVWSWGWTWPPEEGRRRGVPWIGIFLLLLGGLLLVEQFVPSVQVAGSAFLLALGLAFLISWAIDRGPGALYVGAILTALGLSNVLSDTGAITGPGWGTLFLGIAFAFIALIRVASGGGWGWQVWFAAILVVIGGARIAERQVLGLPDLGRYLWPLILVALGVWLLYRARGRGAYP